MPDTGTQSSPMSVLSSDITRPSVVVQQIQTAMFKCANLSKELANWREWNKSLRTTLVMSGGLDGHLDDTFPCPDITTEPRAFRNWNINDRAVRAFMDASCVPAEQTFMETFSSAKEVYTKLKARHEQEGPITQIQLIQDALEIRYSKSVRLSDTTEKLAKLNDRIWKMAAPTPDIFLMILIINALSDPELSQVRRNVAQAVNRSTADAPATSSSIINDLDLEQKLLDGDKKTNDIALAAAASSSSSASNAQRSFSHLECSNPKCPRRRGHIIKYCVSEGGGMAGKTIDESRAAKRRDRDPGRSAGASAPSSATMVTDSSGRAYILSNNTVFLVSAPTPPSQPSEFTAMAFDMFTPAYVDSITTPADRLEYEGWLAFEDTIRTSVDWHERRRDVVDLAALTVAPPNLNSRTNVVDMDKLPFWLDTAATTHISPERTDFIDLRPIYHRTIRGVGNSTLNAIGIGTVKLRVSGRTQPILLENVLYSPNATVRLLSIPSLARDSRITAHFNYEGCWLTQDSTGTTIATGKLCSSRRLYHLHLSSPTVDHTFASITGQPTLETWHRRLGHTNYQSIIDMARKGMVTDTKVSSKETGGGA